MGVLLIVKCPKCGRLQIFLPVTKDYRKWRKKCVYCGYSFTINPKSKHSNSIIVMVTTNPRKAQDFIKKYQKI
ncbi:MAG TPA: hypothetical protein EYH22_01160 [Candidatus Nanopusillus sp.]|nr:hypothetical protein [Candidatus Nanopusillus sp.]